MGLLKEILGFFFFFFTSCLVFRAALSNAWKDSNEIVTPYPLTLTWWPFTIFGSFYFTLCMFIECESWHQPLCQESYWHTLLFLFSFTFFFYLSCLFSSMLILFMYCRLPRPGEETSSLQPAVSDVSPETRKVSMADQSPRHTQEKESEDESSRKKRRREEKKKEKHERREKRHSQDLDDKRKHKKDKERRRHDSD